jgi:hypothetical protein
VLLGSGTSELWSKRATTEVDQTRSETTAADTNGLVAERDLARGRTTWWTFAGLLGNAEIARTITQHQPVFDNCSITMDARVDPRAVVAENDSQTLPTLSAIGAVKFRECLPPSVLAAMHKARVSDQDAAAFVRRSAVLWRQRDEMSRPQS